MKNFRLFRAACLMLLVTVMVLSVNLSMVSAMKLEDFYGRYLVTEGIASGCELVIKKRYDYPVDPMSDKEICGQIAKCPSRSLFNVGDDYFLDTCEEVKNGRKSILLFTGANVQSNGIGFSSFDQSAYLEPVNDQMTVLVIKTAEQGAIMARLQRIVE